VEDVLVSEQPRPSFRSSLAARIPAIQLTPRASPVPATVATLLTMLCTPTSRRCKARGVSSARRVANAVLVISRTVRASRVQRQSTRQPLGRYAIERVRRACWQGSQSETGFCVTVCRFDRHDMVTQGLGKHRELTTTTISIDRMAAELFLTGSNRQHSLDPSCTGHFMWRARRALQLAPHQGTGRTVSGILMR
jgi:hypothetical protein